ncbi:MAG: hypothetical protein ABWX93_06770 [Pseudoxanthomonas sp.]
MKPAVFALTLAAGLGLAAEAVADDAPGRALRPELWFSSDADGNETSKQSLGWDVRRIDEDHWLGVKIEHARFAGDDWSRSENRIYGRAAGGQGNWRWKVDAGSNGKDLLGGASLHSQDARRKEFFIERELLETRQGAEQDLMLTFAGAAIDLPLGTRWGATALAGLQDFGSGENLRTHLRGNLVFAALPEQGISLQVRTRYFRNSVAHEGDYYSPEWHGEALGVLALRRNRGGYQWRALIGAGRQRNDVESWRSARLLEIGVDTPHWKKAWLRANAGYRDTPVVGQTGDGTYAYRFASIEAVIDL